MKNLLLLWLLIYVFTGNLAFAEKAMSPVLLAPTNFAKSISKDSIKFTWQNAQNEVNAKVNAYRIIISENSQFNGYSQSTGRCNITCVTSVINSTTFTTALRSSNKTYYWRVQGLSSIENGEWSRTGTFKTDVPVPSITNASATPSPVTQGSTLTIASTLSGLLPSNYSVKLNDNGNLYVMIGSGTNYSLSQSPSIIGSRNYSVGVYDINNNLKSSLFNGTYEVKKPNTAPTLSFISGNATATTGTNYMVQLQGNDIDNNLSQITINWGDGTSNSQNTASGSTLTFTHTYATANSYTWSVTAYDSANATSDNLAKTVTVSSPVLIPSISSAGASPSSTTSGNSINFSATLSSNLPSGYTVKLSYGNSSVSMSGSGTNYSVVQTPTLLGQQVFTVGVYDTNNTLKSNSFTGNFEIVKANAIPTLSFISGNTTATAGTSNSVQLQASDADNNLKSITVVWGDGATDTQNATNGTTLTFTHTYATANTYNWSATALDSGNASSSVIAKTVNVSAAVVTTPVSTAGYTKISNTGATLPDTAVLGSGSNDWACTKDNKTGLIWEVKTTDGGLRDMYKTYHNYFAGEAGYGVITNADFFVKEVNKQGLCGVNNWRLPTKEELEILFTKTSTVNKPINIPRYIDANYFPNTDHYGFWSSSPVTNISSNSWYGDFNLGFLDASDKSNDGDVRLVSEPTFSTTNYTKISNSGVALPDTAVLGSGSNDWACTKDNKTGLIWEVKTDDGGLRDMNQIYTNYFEGESGYGEPHNSDYFVSEVNKKTLCGKNEWRLPNNEELKGLIFCSDGKYSNVNKDILGRICTNSGIGLVTVPTINVKYFPNTQSSLYWSSSYYSNYSGHAWYVNLSYGESSYGYKFGGSYIRLVN